MRDWDDASESLDRFKPINAAIFMAKFLLVVAVGDALITAAVLGILSLSGVQIWQ